MSQDSSSRCSGKFVAMAIVAEDGQPLEESSAENQESLVKTAVTDKRVLQWMLVLSQIGMDDICSPMIILLEDEADAFWCFERAMARVRENTSMGVQTQLGMLSQDLDGGEFMFAIRMLMVLFRREFSFLDAFYLWEDPRLLKQYGKFERKYIKSGQNEQHDSTLAVFVVASVLETKNKRLLKEAKGLDDVVQILGGIAGNLDARKACKEALKIHEKFLRKVTILLLIIRLLLL
ncbi:hypothetical protein IGI04_019893 [Brassica rapa subsp. trilocularis]|uniref:Rab-GAP TBC domain-containing protein n=1 Tax=Brassica rapa subsp. trilocularis TaxID=1813537 RepID=A0ABQ7MH68_BRACM|nr:hypothetical protein IGI04_019893 [Brassica rapa subsp. trilocularis]